MRILIVIPCYNEGSNIGTLLQEIRELSDKYDKVVIDDCSADDTYAIASRLSSCVRLVGKLGIGGAVQTGIKYAVENNYDLCIQVDGDGQHPPDQIERLIKSYMASPTNMVIGTRFLLRENFRSTWSRRLGIQVISVVIHWLFGQKITDPTSGFRLMDRAVIRLFHSDYPLDFPEPVAVAIALQHGLTIQEVGVRMRSRQGGSSSISGIKTIIYMARVIGYLFLVRLRPQH